MLKRRNFNQYGKVIFLIITAVFVSFASGCAAITIPNPEDVVKHPLGTESIKVGMTKAQVESLWGKPSQVKMVEDKNRWQGSREVWIYRAQYSSIPVDAGYLSSTKKLYFDGNNLTDIGE